MNTIQWSDLLMSEQREVKRLYTQVDKLAAVKYIKTIRNCSLMDAKHGVERWVDNFQWVKSSSTPSTPACGFDVRQTRRQRKQAELAKRYIEQVGGTVVLDTVTLRQREIEQLQYVLKNHLDITNIAAMATLLKTCSKE